MKLSEAILAGSRLRPCLPTIVLCEQGSCSIGAALEAVGALQIGEYGAYGRLHRVWPWTDHLIQQEEWPEELSSYQIEIYTGIECDFASAISIMTLHWWSRERVAEWVATIEARDAAAAGHDPYDCDVWQCQACRAHWMDEAMDRAITEQKENT